MPTATPTSRPNSQTSENPATSPATPTPHRSMSTEMIDLIRDGVSPADLHARGGRSVWDAVGCTALAAVNSGWSAQEWKSEVTRATSKLGHQLRVRQGGKAKSAVQVEKELDRAWTRAVDKAAASPAWSKDQARVEAESRASSLLLIVADSTADLSDKERTLLAFIASEAVVLGSTQVNLPRLSTMSATGLKEKSVRWNLDKLVRRGFLTLVDPGRARKHAEDRRAAVYRLPDESMLRLAAKPVLSRETRQVGPADLTDGPWTPTTPGPKPKTDGPSSTQVFTAAEVRRALGPNALGLVVATAQGGRASRDRADHPGALDQVCSLIRPHDPHPYGPVLGAHGLAYWCPGADELPDLDGAAA